MISVQIPSILLVFLNILRELNLQMFLLESVRSKITTLRNDHDVIFLIERKFNSNFGLFLTEGMLCTTASHVT